MFIIRCENRRHTPAPGAALAAVQAPGSGHTADNPASGHEYVEVADAHTCSRLAAFKPRQKLLSALRAPGRAWLI
jgi:hypothetical protein